jgi:hypothetical protein
MEITMSALTFFTNEFATQAIKKESPVIKQSFGQRFMAALIASRQRQADIEIRKAMALHGDKASVKIDYAMLPFRGE